MLPSCVTDDFSSLCSPPLPVASCIGIHFDLPTLARISGLELKDATRGLWKVSHDTYTAQPTSSISCGWMDVGTGGWADRGRW